MPAAWALWWFCRPCWTSSRAFPPPQSGQEEAKPQEKADFGALAEEELTFTYDTVFIVRRTGGQAPGGVPGLAGDHRRQPGHREGDEEFKVHVHTDDPGLALTKAQEYGTLELAKIENMRTQRDELAAGKQAQSTDDLEAVEAELEAMEQGTPPPPRRRRSMALWRWPPERAWPRCSFDLGADGGHQRRPDHEPLHRGHPQADPQDPGGDCLCPAQQQEHHHGRPAVRGPGGGQEGHRPPGQDGAPGHLRHDRHGPPDGEEADNTAAMEAAMAGVTTMEVTYAARDSEFDGTAIHAGDYLPLVDNQLFGTEKNLDAALDKLAQESAQREGVHQHLLWRGRAGRGG